MDINKHMVVGAVNQNKVEQPKDNAVLNQDDFLKILAATISNPPIPGSGGDGGAGGEMDFMSQMMQMNLLDQVTELTSTIQSTMVMTQQQQALSLVGKKVTVAGDESKVITGIVDKIRFTPEGIATLEIAGVEYNLQNVTSVEEAGSAGNNTKPDEIKPEAIDPEATNSDTDTSGVDGN